MLVGGPRARSGASGLPATHMLSSSRTNALGSGLDSSARRSAVNRRAFRLQCRITKEQQVGSANSPLDILVGDIRYLRERTGVDLLTTLAPVKDVHDQMVAALNPVAGGKMAEDLEEGIAVLQAELEQAHGEVHKLERQLEDTIGYLSGLERSAGTLQSTLDVSSSTYSSKEDMQDEAQLERQRSGGLTQPSQPTSTSQPGQSRSGALRSGLEMPPALRNFWFPAEFSAALKPGETVAFSLFEEPLLLSRDQQGTAACLHEACAHRQDVPSQPLPIIEADGLIWVWVGESEPEAEIPQSGKPPEGFTVHTELLLEVPVEHGLLLENLLDLAHAPFTHTSTFAKGWPIPDIVRFNAAKLLGGNWEPYPIDMSFEPPCMVLSTIGLAQPGKIERGVRAANCKKHLHQLHVCLPAGPGRTRLLYRMSMDFLAWTKYVPFIQHFWSSIANQVLGEDLVLVAGQQERMLAGANVWANPVSYDKLGVRYRRWRNSLASGSKAEQNVARDDLYPMAAGELFSLNQQR